MALIDLKRPKPTKKDTLGKGAVLASDSYDERPYNLRFTLEAPELKALGLKAADFAGMEPITATVVLDPISIRDITSKTGNDYDRNSNQSVEFQVQKIDLGTLTAKTPSKFDAVNDQRKKGPED